MNSLRVRVANIGVGGSLAWMGDCLCQYMEASKGKVWNEKWSFDWHRNASFTAFGSFYMGGFAHIVYTRYIPWILSRKVFLKSLNQTGKTNLKRGIDGSLLDNTLHAPLFYLPSYFIFTDTMRGQDSAFIIQHFEESYFPTLLTLWGIWIPVQMITFSVMPTHLRTTFVNTVCLIWNIWLDFYSNANYIKHSHDDD